MASESNEASIFNAARKIDSADDRRVFLAEACGDDAALRERVDKLLVASAEESQFLENPAAAMLAGLIGRDIGVSQIRSLGNTLNDVSQVSLRDSEAEGADPIARPNSREIPQHDSDGRYQIQGEIARGGMGVILKGRDTDLGRDLAIKVLLDTYKSTPEVIQRFVEEAQIGGQLQHPGIAPVYEMGQFPDQRLFFSMKLVKGQTLARLMADRENPADERGKFIGIFEQVCQTMAYAHSRGVIHRDLKPANIMVGAFGEVQVMDWGLAKVLQAGGIQDEKQAREKHEQTSIIRTTRSPRGDTAEAFGTHDSQTQMGSVLGTPAYMPPEQALGEIDQLDERADVFGLGAILAEILTGKPPYVDDDPTQVFRMASRGKLTECFDRVDACGADSELIGLTRHCLEVEAADRPRDATDLAQSVTGYLESVETKLRKTELAKVDALARAEEYRRRRNLHLAIAGMLLLGLVSAGFAVNHFRSLEETQRTLASEKSILATRNQKLAEDREAQRIAAEKARNDANRLAAEAEVNQEIAERESYLSTIKRAELMLQGNQQLTYQVAGLLWDTAPALRGWEWGHLMAQCPLEEWSLESNHGSLDTLAASADGRYLATSGSDGFVALWDTQAGTEIWRAQTGRARQISIDPQLRFVAVGTAKKYLKGFRILDFANGHVITKDPKNGVTQLAFSHDGNHLYALRGAIMVRIDTQTWQPLAQKKFLQGILNLNLIVDLAGAYVGVQRGVQLEEKRNKRALFSFLDAETLKMTTDLNSFKSDQSEHGLHATPVLDSANSLLLHADGFGAVFESTLSNSGPATRSCIGNLPGRAKYLAIDTQTTTSIAASDEGSILVVNSKGESRSLHHGGPMQGLLNLGDGRFVTGGTDGRIKCWSLNPPAPLAVNLPIAPSNKKANFAAFVGDSQKLVLSGNGNWSVDLETHQFVALSFDEEKNLINSVRPRTSELLVRDKTGIYFHNFDATGNFAAANRTMPIGNRRDVVFDGTGRVIVYRVDGKVFAYDLEEERQLPTPEFPEFEDRFKIAASRTRAAIHTPLGLYVWEISTGRLISHLAVPSLDRSPLTWRVLPMTPAIHPDEKLVALIADRGQDPPEFIIWDVEEQEVHNKIALVPGVSFWDCVFTPDGSRLIVACSDSRFRVIDWSIGKELIALSDTTTDLGCPLAVSPDGRTIAYGGHDPSLRIARALPWIHSTPNEAFYRAVDELRAFSARVADGKKLSVTEKQ
jgi:serine/threonine protein kinase/WD40 repeat protein